MKQTKLKTATNEKGKLKERKQSPDKKIVNY